MILWLIKELMMFLILKIWEEVLCFELIYKVSVLDVVRSFYGEGVNILLLMNFMLSLLGVL